MIVYRDTPSEIIKDTIFIKDTLFVEKEIINPNTKFVSNPKPRKNKVIEPKQTSFTFNEQYFYEDQLEEQQTFLGKSSEESGELTQFLGLSI